MSEQPENNDQDRKKQTAELIDMLDELDSKGVPQLKSIQNLNVGVVSKPSFMQKSLPSAPPVQNNISLQDDSNLPINQNGVDNNSLNLPVVPEIPEAPAAPEAPPLPPSFSNFLETEESTGEFFKDMQIFFKQLGRAYNSRYDMWENTFNIVLKILRKMQEIDESNTDIMIKTLEEINEKIKKGLQDFSMKRDEVERFSDIDFKHVTKTYKKTLELLNFQVREFKLQQMINELYEIYS